MIFNKTQRIVTWVIAIAIFMENVDATALTTAIPAMAISLQKNPIDLKIALTSYLFSLAVFMPASGWLADKFGAKKIFSLAIIIFSAGSIFCGLSHNLFFLVLARILQGFGGAILMPTARIILFQTFSKSEILAVNNYTTIPGILGWAVGPTVGGLLTTHLSWRWIFYINIPMGILGLYLTIKYLTNIKKTRIDSLDLLGFILFGTGLACLSFSLGLISEGLWQSQLNLMIFGSAFLALLIYALHTRRPQHTLLDLSLFKIRTFSIAFIGTIINRTCIGGIPFVTALMLQNGLGYSAAKSGYLMAAYAFGAMASRMPCKYTLTRYGFKKQLIISTLLCSLSVLLLACINQQNPSWFIMLLMFFNGAVTGMQFVTMNLLYYADVPTQSISKVTVLTSINQQISMSFGVAFAALLLQNFASWHDDILNISVKNFQHCFLIIGFIPLFSLLIYAKLKHHDGATMSQQK